MDTKEFKNIFKNKYGYFEVKNPGSPQESQRIFTDKYYQNSMSVYKQEYEEEELIFFENKLKQKEMILKHYLPERDRLSFLDIGCGEGFALSYFHRKGYEVMGIDFSSYGIERHNPQMKTYLRVGDCEIILSEMIENNKKFDIINLDGVLNVLHNPEKILTLIGNCLTEDGVLLIKVANNYSVLQLELLKKKKIRKAYWAENVEGG